MAILTKKEIIDAIESNKIEFNPGLDAFQIQPHAIDLRLGWTFYIPKSWTMTENGRQALNIDYLSAKQTNDSYDIIELKPSQYFEILPQESIIAVTLEKISINDLQIMSVLYPRSSFNRKGLSVSLTGIIDAGYSGSLLIPIRNTTTSQVIKMYPGERVCQVVFEQLVSELNKNEALLHGMQKAKYMNSDEKSITYKNGSHIDSRTETELIRSGSIDLIKENYSIL